MMLFEIASGSYAQIFLTDALALKRPLDKITEETAYFIFREGLYLKNGFGPRFLGPGVRYENNRYKFVGYFMERYEESLSKYVPVKQTHFCLFYDIARALENLHQNGHVHCDIKPSNILVNKDCKASLTDFGLSSYSSVSGPSPCRAQGPLYTPVFRSPEHLMGNVTVTSSSDIWAFGMTLLVSVLLPRYPGLATSDPGKLVDYLHVYVDPEDPKRLDDIKELCKSQKIPESFATIVSTCLSWNPEKRPSASEVRKEFENYKDKRSHVLSLKLTRPTEIDVSKLNIEPLKSISISQFQKERLSLNLKNFCVLLNIDVNEVILEQSIKFCTLLDTYRPNLHNPAIACLMSLYTIRDSASLQFSTCAKMCSCTVQHFVNLLEESICFVLQFLEPTNK